MFILLGLCASFGYALQNSLMVAVWRRMDTLCAVALRGLALGLTMLPLLVFVPGEKVLSFGSFLPLMFVASLFAALGNWAAATSYCCLPVSKGSAICTAATTVGALALSWLMLGERLGGLQTVFIFLLIAAVSALVLQKKELRAQLDCHQPAEQLSKENACLSNAFDYRLMKGVACAISAGFFFSAAYALVGMVSRRSHPFLAAYCWELMIGFVALGLIALRSCLGRETKRRFSRESFIQILKYSSPTVIGTAGYALSTTMGPVAVATAVLSTTIIGTAILAQLFYDEQLNRIQWGLIFLVCLLLAGLNLTQ